MTPHAVQIGDLKPKHFNLLKQVTAVVNALPDGLTCHDVCKAVVKAIPGLYWIKGRFSSWDHSWLEVVGERVIIDAYPWASHRPLMVVNQTGTPWAFLYRGEVQCHNEVGGQTDAERNRADAPAETAAGRVGAACPAAPGDPDRQRG